ncbi:hypothetical protein [Microvirga rosea]|uniref:hypothetical protein n=1 Tax=Microvirga rosea TaxID=2715425 RepID=UPI001D0AD55F|nr:hypothetical protein [Microvirga rosea]MCB8821483.1 hypothetical protein [Microvirga rosea]
MSMKAILTTLLLVAAGPASAECVYKNAYNHLTNEYITIPVSCPSVTTSQNPKYRSWHECPIHEERNAKTGDVYQVRTCA